MKLCIATPEEVGCSSKRLARIRPIMQSYVDQRGFAGISTLLMRRGRVVHFEQVGWQDRESGTPLAADTIFRLYSMTKSITCTAFMILYEAGLFQLYDPVARFIPAFGKVRVLNSQEVELVRPITIQDLLTHTAGLTYDFCEDSPVGEMYRQLGLMRDAERSLEALIGELSRLPLAYQPGSTWHYSLAIDVIGHLIEVISGQPLAEFMREHLFEPLGMIDTGFCVSAEKRCRIATMYGLPDICSHTMRQIGEAWMRGFNQRIDVEQTYPSANTYSFVRGGHGLFSTMGDYARFAQMLLNGGELDGERVLAPSIVEFMHLNHVAPALLPFAINGVTRSGYGFGLGSQVLLNVAESALPGSFGEVSGGGATRTHFWLDPRKELVGILMTQYMAGYDLPEKDLHILAHQAMID